MGHKTGTGDRNAKGQQIGCNDIGFILLPDGHAYSIAVFVKDSEADNRENSEIIAEISRIVYEYVTQQRYQRIHLRLQYRCPITKPATDTTVHYHYR